MQTVGVVVQHIEDEVVPEVVVVALVAVVVVGRRIEDEFVPEVVVVGRRIED